MLPLEGVTVVAIEQAIAVPFATRQLADLGARVIKVERPETGDFARNYDTTVNGMSSHFVWCNRSKESITLDLKSIDGKHILKKLIEKSDVLIQNLAPGALKRMGFDPYELIEEKPELIVCNLSGYGEDGPYSDKKAYDLLVQCETGLVSITGTEDEPSKAGIPNADIAAGMYAYSGILAALLNRMKTGKGDVIEISMLEALGEWMGYPMYYSAFSGNEPRRTGASHANIYPYGPFKCGDEKTVFIGLQNEREWHVFCEKVLDQPSLTTDPRFNSNEKRSENREELKIIIENQFSNKNSQDLIEQLEGVKIANARLNNLKDFYEHPQLKARNRWGEVRTPIGHVPALRPPITFNNIKTVMDPVPALGEHTEQILEELGIQGGVS